MRPAAARSFLVAAQNGDGGWGYRPGEPSLVEPTAAAVLALDASAGPAGPALAWLQAGQHADGGWGLNHSDPHSGWSTAWALLALARAGAGLPAAVTGRGVAWLLATPVLQVTEDEIQRDIARTLAIDIRLRGWPWRPGEASWIEPTALAMLALQAVAGAAGQAAAAARLDEARRYLEDRRCRAGGWNCGNPVMLGAALPPRAHPTAWAVLALTRRAPAAVLAQDLAALRGDMHEDGGVLALAWGLLALRTRGLDDASAAARLAGLQGEGGDWGGNAYYGALGLLVAERRAIL